jgi:flagellin-specific chaperone FliS|tara:strand:- start:206 stop:511 length:306 start_codon:yes stop_codon:yes gene_type:complete
MVMGFDKLNMKGVYKYMSNQLIELNSLVMTSKDNNEIVERLKSFLENQKKEKRVNWQMLACYLDGKIFEFIQANKDNEVVMKFATELVEELAEQFNLTRNL